MFTSEIELRDSRLMGYTPSAGQLEVSSIGVIFRAWYENFPKVKELLWKTIQRIAFKIAWKVSETSCNRNGNVRIASRERLRDNYILMPCGILFFHPRGISGVVRGAEWPLEGAAGWGMMGRRYPGCRLLMFYVTFEIPVVHSGLCAVWMELWEEIQMLRPLVYPGGCA